jgi:cytochrome c
MFSRENNMLFIRCLLYVSLLCSYQTYISAQPESLPIPEPDGQDSQDSIARKEVSAKNMVEMAVTLLAKKSMAEVCNTFIFDPAWRKGELIMFVFDGTGVCLMHGLDRDVIWQNFGNEKDKTQRSFIAEMIEKGEHGGWVNYVWDNAIHHAYVRAVQKHGKNYIIGCGFYPQSSRFRTQTLIESAIAYIQEHGAKDAFPRINNTSGIFIKGDIYIVALDFDGTCVAHGNDLSLVGQNLLAWQDDENEVNHYRTIIEMAQSLEGRGWVTYKKDGTQKVVYVAKVTDPSSKQSYAISAGYYPDVDEISVRNLVKKGVDYVKRNGREGLEREFLSKAMRFGSIRLFVYDTEGNVIVDAYDPQFIGQNIMWLKDPDGRPILKLIIEQALQFDRSWVRYLRRNEYKLTYVEKVSTADGVFIVGGGYFPASKEEDARGMVLRAVEFLTRNTKEEAFKAFVDAHGDFIHGDIHVEVHDAQGFILVDGKYRYFLWNNDNAVKDNKGRSITDVFAATAKSGGGWLEMNLHHALNRVFIKSVDKQLPDGKTETVIVSSGYFI